MAFEAEASLHWRIRTPKVRSLALPKPIHVHDSRVAGAVKQGDSELGPSVASEYAVHVHLVMNRKSPAQHCGDCAEDCL